MAIDAASPGGSEGGRWAQTSRLEVLTSHLPTVRPWQATASFTPVSVSKGAVSDSTHTVGF